VDKCPRKAIEPTGTGATVTGWIKKATGWIKLAALSLLNSIAATAPNGFAHRSRFFGAKTQIIGANSKIGCGSSGNASAPPGTVLRG
jgi:hypothetical protein